MGIELSVIWALIILFSIMMYIVMDGFDLGLGILYPFFPDKEQRDVLMNTVAPVWDGNETWLVLGGAGLLAAFPLAYSVVLSALYLPVILMLIGLVFRGVAFEFRFKALEHERHFWDKAFIGGSVTATFFQGVTLGAYVQGIAVVDRAYAGQAFDWLTPFSVCTGLGLIAAFALLGSSWLIIKTVGTIQQRAYQITAYLNWILLAFIGLISIWTAATDTRIAELWFSWPNFFWLCPVPLLVLLFSYGLKRAVAAQLQIQPFVFTLLLVFLGYCGLGISLWPYIIPPSVSIWQAAAPPQSQGFALVGALFIIPIILVYTAWAYYVFRGKVTADQGYH
jgi:cytochrome d ubiquinol oxidase subunit II